MKPSITIAGRRSCLRISGALSWIASAALLIACHAALAASNVQLWDNQNPFSESVSLENRSQWKVVPCNLLALETDPLKASLDPGYYGREYAFKGDAIVENRYLAVVCWSAKGQVMVYAKDPNAPTSAAASTNAQLGQPVAVLVPSPKSITIPQIIRTVMVRNANDQVVLEIVFATDKSPVASVQLGFDKSGIIEFKPGPNLPGLRITSPIDYAVAPSFVGDDLLFNAETNPSADEIWLPAQNFLVNLLRGGDRELVMTWPHGGQKVKLTIGNSPANERRIETLDFDHDQQSFFLAVLAATGLWHREKLVPGYLEKEVIIPWQRPFPARWKTQLYESEIKTTFVFRDFKGQIWRGVPGTYRYPVWFDGDQAFLNLGKKVPPRGESVIYFLEGRDTPASVATPVDILKGTLGRAMAESMLDSAGRKLRTHHRRGGDGVRRACTCGCTEAIQAVFEAGQEVEKKEYISGAVDDMIFFVQCHLDRIQTYQRFVEDLTTYLHSQAAALPEFKPYLDQLELTAMQIPKECEAQKENMKSLAHAHVLAGKTLALADRKDAQNLKAYMALLSAWREMGGAQDYVVAQCHGITRKLGQEAGYGSVTDPKALPLAMEIRSRCRQALRHADGYEIWADY